MNDRLIFVGLAPGKKGLGPHGPLAGGVSGSRLAWLMGVSRENWLRYRRVNLCERWGGKQGKGDAHDPAEAKLNARRLQHLEEATHYVLLGRAVVKAFGLRIAPLQSSYVVSHDRVVSFFHLPHPSGINHYWNDPAATEKAIRKLNHFVEWSKIITR